MKEEKYIFMSVVIPVYNDPAGIVITLNSLISQNYPKEKYEIIVVDNNSTDNTRKTINRIAKNYPGLIKILKERKIQTSYAARNRGINSANGELLAFIDSDMWMDKDWLLEILNYYKKKNFSYLGCKIIITANKNNIFEKYNIITGFPVKDYLRDAHFAPTAALIVKKSLFYKVGLFKQFLVSGGDFEFGNRVYKAGIKQYYVEDIKIYHPARSSFRSLLRKYLRVGSGNLQLSKIDKKYANFGLKSFFPISPWKFLKLYNTRPKNVSEVDFMLIYLLDYFMKLTVVSSFLKNKFKKL